MDQPSDDRDRGFPALRVAGVGLGLLGATFGGVAGWFTLAPSAPSATTVVATRTAGSSAVEAEPSTLSLAAGRAHTRTGGN